MQVGLLVANLAWTTLCLGGFLAQTMIVTSALSGVLLGVHVMARAFDRRVRRSHPAGWLFLPFLVYAAANVQWVTPVRWLGWADWLGWTQMVLVFWVVLNSIRSRGSQLTLAGAIMGLGIVLVVLASFQRYVAPEWLMLGRTQAGQFLGRASGSFGAPNSLAAFLLLVLPVAAALTFRPRATAAQRVGWGYVMLLLGFGLVLTISRGAWLALAIVVVLAPVVVGGTSRFQKLRSVLLAILGVGGVIAALFFNVPAVQDRLTQLQTHWGEPSRPIMWRAALEMIRDEPVWGGGAGSYAVRFDQYRPENFQLEARWAHNDYLNTLSDYGGVGFVLLMAACVVGVVRCARTRVSEDPDWFRGRSATIGGWIGVAAFSLQLAVDFNLKIPSLAMTFAAIVALLVQRHWPGETMVPRPSRQRKVFFVSAAVGSVAATMIWVVPLYQGESLRQSGRRSLDQLSRSRDEPRPALIGEARERVRKATEESPNNGYAWADLAYLTSLLVRFDAGQTVELGREAERHADRALACSNSVAEFWVQRGIALDLQGRWVDAGTAFIRAMTLAPTRAGVWYQQAVHLSRDPTDPERALAAARFALRLDPGNAEAHALRERLTERSRAP